MMEGLIVVIWSTIVEGEIAGTSFDGNGHVIAI